MTEPGHANNQEAKGMIVEHQVSITVPRSLTINANDRLHWTQRARRTKALRLRGFNAGEALPKFTSTDRVRIIIRVWKPTARRYDQNNLAPTAKALVDGLVDAGVIVDDDYRHLDGPHLEHGGVDKGIPDRIRFDVCVIPVGDAL